MNSKRFVFLIGSLVIVIVLHGLLGGAAQAVKTDKQNVGAKVKTWAKFEELPLGAIRPEGWLLRSLELQRDGFMGHLEEIGFPFNSDAWQSRDPIGPDPRVARRHRGWTERWNWHITANWLEATLRNGYLLDDEAMIEKVRKRINYNLQHQTSDGALGPRYLNGADQVARPAPTEFLHLLATEYSATGDERIVEALKKYFQKGMRDGQERSGGNSAGGSAEDYQIAIVLWLYAQTGDETYLDEAKAAFALNGKGKLAELLSDTRNEGHGYFWLVGKTIPVLMYKYTGERKYLDAVINGYRKLDRDQMLQGGVPSSSEFLRTNTSLDAVEACNATNFPVGLASLLQATGDVTYADKIEKAIFNFLPGVMTSDFKAYQYHSSPNQVVATAESNHSERSRDIDNHARGSAQLMAFRPIHTCPCCAANVPRALPNFISWMFQKSNDDDLTAVLYGPARITTKVGKRQKEITILEQTDYPFADRIDFTIRTDEPVQFNFRLRIPGWCKRASVLVNGKPIASRVATGEYAEVGRTFKNNDTVTLILPMEIQLSHWPRSGIGVERGPLAYSLRIEEDWRKRPKIFGVIDAKELDSTPNFPGWDLYAVSPWNYALAVDEENLANTIRVVKHPMNSEPWSIANAPIELLVPAQLVSGWKIGEDGLTPQLPDPATLNERLSDTVKMVRLVPFGCAKLRISVFPQSRRSGSRLTK